MKPRPISQSFILALVCLALTTTAAFAKPSHDGSKVTITGPGIAGTPQPGRGSRNWRREGDSNPRYGF